MGQLLNHELRILNFHRIIDAEQSNLIYDITNCEFERILAYVQVFYNILPMGEAISKLLYGTLPFNSVVITFDDGYQNNYSLALPILKRKKVNATFYIASGFLDGGWMWNDGIIEAISKTEKKSLNLSMIGCDCKSIINNDKATMELIDSVLEKIKYFKPEKRINIAKMILDEASVPEPDGLMMTSDQVKELSKQGMEIGGHTVNHPILTSIDHNSACKEILENKLFLEELIGKQIHSFAYPNGKYGKDFNDEHMKIVNSCGYTSAVATDWGRATAKSDMFRLPRFTPWDRNPLLFCMRLFFKVKNKE